MPAGAAIRWVPYTLATLVPLACYLATASAYGYWFDGGEFVAASADFGISHPPGHPLAQIIGGAFTLLPFGPIAFRVALASAFMAAVACGFLFRAIEQTIETLAPWKSVATPLALGATYVIAGSSGWWFQAVRPEVYALQAALMALVIERLVAIEVHGRGGRALNVAAFALGLALANHHFLAFLIFPAAAATLARFMMTRGVKPLLVAIGHTLVGLLTYIYLPLRALADPYVNLGEPNTASRVFWVVSAQAFQKNQGDGVPQPLWERFADVGVQLVLTLHPATVLCALLGIYVALRYRASRRVGSLWIAILVVYVAARAWLGFVRSNPDALGYLMPGMAAIGALAAVALAGVLRFVGGELRKPRFLAPVFAYALMGLGGYSLIRGRDATLATFHDTDDLDSGFRRDLPPRAIVLSTQPQTAFRFWGGEAEELLRPDVTFVSVPLLPYPGMIDRLVRRAPELRDLLRGQRLDDEFRLPDLQSLAAVRPTLLELDVRVQPELYDTLIPNGLYYQVLADGATPADVRIGAAARVSCWYKIAKTLRTPDDPETRAQLLWKFYMDALYFAGVGEQERALTVVRRARKLNPDEIHLAALEAAIQQALAGFGGALDIRPFLVNRASDDPREVRE